MKKFNLEQAQEYLDDPEAIKRGYLSEAILQDAERLALAVKSMPSFGKVGYLGEIGSPDSWWCDNCSCYKEISQKYSDRQFSFLQRLSEEMISEEKQNEIQSRIEALELFKKSGGLSALEEREYLTLRSFLGLN